MKQLILALIGIWAIFQVVDIVRSPDRQIVRSSLARLAEPPVHQLSDPYRNAYFLVIGFAASASSDPAKVGYDTWVEARETSGGNVFDYDKLGRSDLRIPVSLPRAVPAWDADDPLSAFRTKDPSVRSSADRFRILVNRYDHCLGMPFEDWGFGQRAAVRYEDVMIAHRLYVAEGFARSADLGMDRLYRELVFWRAVLRAAATITTKVAAQIVIQDDAKLLSRMLGRPNVDKSIMGTALRLMIPLTPSEYSLRLPIRHQVALAVRPGEAGPRHTNELREAEVPELEWLSATAHLPAGAFRKIEHPSSRSTLRDFLGGRQSSELYAAYYDALISFSSGAGNRLPRLQEIAQTIPRGMVERLLNQVPVEPEWDTFNNQLMETDARLRLTSLQVQVRKPGATTAVPVRLAEVGSQYFDPFTGLPMLWSPTQQRLYSVGQDHLDDGGDPSFDITVPAVMTSPRVALPPPGGSYNARHS